MALCDILIENGPLSNWKVELGGCGKWDEKEIEKMTDKLGLELVISPDVD